VLSVLRLCLSAVLSIELQDRPVVHVVVLKVLLAEQLAKQVSKIAIVGLVVFVQGANIDHICDESRWQSLVELVHADGLLHLQHAPVLLRSIRGLEALPGQ